MKIAFFMPALGMVGVESAFENLLSGLYLEKNLEIIVFRQRPITETAQIDWFMKHPKIKVINCYPLADAFENLQTKCRFFPLKQLRKIVFSVYKICKQYFIAQQVSKLNIDFVIDYVGGDSLKFIKKLHNVPTMVVIHGAIQSYPKTRINKFKLYDKILVLSKRAVLEMNTRYPQYKSKVFQLYNALDMQSLSINEKRDTSKLGKYFVSVSRLAKDKDIETIIKAFDEFWNLNKHPKCNLVIIGDGDNKQYLEYLVKELPSREHILFLGKIQKPYDYISNALANILSSNLEALPTTIIESGCVETLNVVADCPDGPREMLLDGKAGVLFEPGNIKELSKIMSDIWNKCIHTEILVSNMTKSLKRFEPKTIAKQFINLIKKKKDKNGKI